MRHSFRIGILSVIILTTHRGVNEDYLNWVNETLEWVYILCVLNACNDIMRYTHTHKWKWGLLNEE